MAPLTRRGGEHHQKFRLFSSLMYLLRGITMGNRLPNTDWAWGIDGSPCFASCPIAMHLPAFSFTGARPYLIRGVSAVIRSENASSQWKSGTLSLEVLPSRIPTSKKGVY